MERHTTCNDPRSMGKHIPEEKHLVRTSASSHRDLQGAHEDVISKDPQKGCRLQIKTIKIPRAMKNEAFLQHPDLTMGQKRYLCSIARIYSTSNMRALTAEHWDSRITCGSKKVHLNLPASRKSKNEIKGAFQKEYIEQLQLLKLQGP